MGKHKKDKDADPTVADTPVLETTLLGASSAATSDAVDHLSFHSEKKKKKKKDKRAKEAHDLHDAIPELVLEKKRQRESEGSSNGTYGEDKIALAPAVFDDDDDFLPPAKK